MKKRTLLIVHKYRTIKTQSCVDKKSSFFHWGCSSKQWRIVPNWPILGSIRRIPSRVTASGYIFRSTFLSLFDVLCSDECQTKKAFQCIKKMLPLFRAVFNNFLDHDFLSVALSILDRALFLQTLQCF